MTGDLIVINSEKHFEVLMSQNTYVMDDTGSSIRDDEPRTELHITGNEIGNSFDHESNGKYDILAINREGEVDLSGSKIEAEEDYTQFNTGKQTSPMNFQEPVNPYSLDKNNDPYNVDTHDGPEVDHLEESYKNLDNYENIDLNDSLDVHPIDSDVTRKIPHFQNPNSYRSIAQMHQDLKHRSEGNKKQNYEDCDVLVLHHQDVEQDETTNNKDTFEEDYLRRLSKDEDIHPKPNFKYKEPAPKFLQKNKSSIGRGRQGSYSQKYLSEKASNERKTKFNPQNRNTGEVFMVQNEGRNYSEHNIDSEHNNEHGNDGLVDSNHGLQSIENLKYLRQNLEISRLEDMIREEEESLKNNVLKLNHTQMQKQTDHLRDSDYFRSNVPQMQFDDGGLRYHETNPAESMIGFPSNVSRYHETDSVEAMHGFPNKDDHNKEPGYATIHSVHSIGRGEKVNPEQTLGYAAQHLEKRIQHNYKKYSLRDYKSLSKDMKLNQSLGPDMMSEEYLEKVWAVRF